MAARQAVMTGTLDVAVLRAVEDELAVLALDRAVLHGRRLRTLLRLHETFTVAGAELSTAATVALADQVSEQAVELLLQQAVLLRGLPGGLEAVECGLLGVEHAAVLTRQLMPLAGEVRLRVWHAIRERLLAAQAEGAVTTPGELGSRLRKVVLQLDADAAVARRKAAEGHGAVELRKRDDGLCDLWLAGLTAVRAQAVMARIKARSLPFGSADDRLVGKRRLDAAYDLLMGRDHASLDDVQNPFHTDEPRPVCASTCGCRLGEPVPCGIGVSILVPIGAALGTTDEVAELAGHGPLDPDLLQAVLHNAPVLRAVHVDDDGIPVSEATRTVTPPARDPVAVREALLALADSRPTGPPAPKHPDDHPPGEQHDGPSGGPPEPPRPPSSSRETPSTGGPPSPAPPASLPAPPSTPLSALPASRSPFDRASRSRLRPAVLANPHPASTPGRYRPSASLRRVLQARAPRCEWPTCSQQAAACDQDHDLAWPDGPTCGCNLGPLCRRHHRLKQLLWHKQRTRAGVRWTSPTGRSWLQPPQHEPAQQPVRPPLPLPDPRGPGDPHLDEGDGFDTGPWDVLRADDPFNQPDPGDLVDPYDDRDPWGHWLQQPLEHA